MAHRYWRVYITAANGTPHLDISEIEFRSSIGGADQCNGGTAIFSNQTGGFEAAKAFDNTTGTTWYINQGSFPLPQWIGYDFGAGNAQDIVQYALTCWASAEMARDFQLQYSDDAAAWTTVDTRNGEVNWTANEVRTYAVPSDKTATSQGQSSTAAASVSGLAALPDILGLDAVYLGQPFADYAKHLSGSDTSLDYVYLAEPIVPTGASPALASGTVATGQAQSSSASASVGAPAPVVATVTTSQGQRVVAIQPLDAAAATSQAQQAAGSAKLGVGSAATTAQGQSASAVGSAVTPWSLVRRDLLDVNIGYTTADGFSDVFPASVVKAGNHILLAALVDATTTATVSDTAGNVYTATLPVAFSDNYTHLQWFYCLNAIGNDANVIRISYTSDVSGQGRYFTALHVQSPGPAAFDVLARNVTNTASTTISAGPFNTAAAGMIAAAICSVNDDTTSVWTNGMEFTTPRSTYFRGTGIRITGGPQTATSVGVTGSTVSTRRVLSAISVVDANPAASTTTRQGQSTSAAASATGGTASVSASTAQAQASAASATLSSSASVASAQGQHGAAQVQLAAFAQAGTAQAQQASSQASSYFDLTATTLQAQAASALVTLAADTRAATSAAQQASGAAVLATNASAHGAQGQSAAGQLGLAVDGIGQTGTVQGASALVAVAFVLDVATSQAQQADVAGEVRSWIAGTTAQAQASSVEAGVAVDASAQSTQRQRVLAQVRGESNNSVETGQRQGVAVAMQLGVIAGMSTGQAQNAVLLAGLAADSTVASGQAQHIGDGNVLIVGVDASVTTGQERQHAQGLLEAYLASPGALAVTSIRLRPALAGTVRLRAAPDHTH